MCLYYHLGQCLAPCVFDVEASKYKEMQDEIVAFLNGGYKTVKNDLMKKMQEAAENMEFEKAGEFRDQINAIETTMEKQKMTMNDFVDRDVFGYAIDKGWMCVQVFFIRQGKLIERDVSQFPFYNDADEDFLTFIGQFYQKTNHIPPKEIYLPDDVDSEAVQAIVPDTKIIVPQRGNKKRSRKNLLTKNAKIALNEKIYAT